MNPVVIVNLKAGGGSAARRWPALKQRLSTVAGPFEVHQTQHAGHAKELAANAALAGCDLIIAAGGDGTVHEAANGIVSTNQPARLALLPLGRGCDFARFLGLRRIDDAIEAIRAAEERCIDLMRVRYRSLDGVACERFAVNVAGFGLGAEAVHRTRSWHSLLPDAARYLASAIPVVAAGYRFPVTLQINEEDPIHQEMALVAIANGQFQGGGIHIAPRARLDDALLDLTLIDPVNLGEVVANAGILFSGRIYSHPKVRHARCRRLRAESTSRVLLELDGEVCGTLPVELEVMPAALRVICHEADSPRTRES